MKRTLDKKRPFAEVYGHSEARYEQFGILFDPEGRELPGYEHVEIPEDRTVLVVSGDEEALKRIIEELQAENRRLITALEDADAEIEGAVGQADSLKVEVARLKEQLAALQPDPSKNAKGKATDVDAQLALQEKG